MMKSLFSKALALSAVLTMSAETLLARDSSNLYILDYEGEEFTGNSTLTLAAKLKRDLGVEIRDHKIETVTLFAKSRHGNGKAALIMNNIHSDQITVDGNPRRFNRNNPNSYFQNTFEAIGDGYVHQNLQIRLQGNFKVLKVLIEVTDESPIFSVTSMVSFYEGQNCNSLLTVLERPSLDNRALPGNLCVRIHEGLNKTRINSYAIDGACTNLYDSFYDACELLMLPVSERKPPVIQPVIGFYAGSNCRESSILTVTSLEKINPSLCYNIHTTLGKPKINSVSVNGGCKNYYDSLHDACYFFK